jgi:hypothetical protein
LEILSKLNTLLFRGIEHALLELEKFASQKIKY